MQDLPEGLSHFGVLGVAPALKLDADDLRERFYALSRLVHPDRFSQKAPPEPSYALRWSTAVNRAYQTLRDPAARSRYLLEAEAFPSPEKAQVPMELAEAYFDLQDLLTETGGEAKLLAFREDLTGQLAATDGEWSRLAEAWEHGDERKSILDRLQKLLTKQKYLRSMIADLEKRV